MCKISNLFIHFKAVCWFHALLQISAWMFKTFSNKSTKWNSLHLLHVNHLFFTFSFSLWNKKTKNKAALSTTTYAPSGRGQHRGSGQESDERPTGAQWGGPRWGCDGGLSISTTQQQRGDFCTTAHVWGFIRIRSEVLMQIFNFP